MDYPNDSTFPRGKKKKSRDNKAFSGLRGYSLGEFENVSKCVCDLYFNLIFDSVDSLLGISVLSLLQCIYSMKDTSKQNVTNICKKTPRFLCL